MDPQRRKEQNRAAQRAFRERKEKQVLDLNAQLENLTSANKKLLEEVDAQQKTIEELQAQILQLESMKDFSCEDWVMFVGEYGGDGASEREHVS